MEPDPLISELAMELTPDRINDDLAREAKAILENAGVTEFSLLREGPAKARARVIVGALMGRKASF